MLRSRLRHRTPRGYVMLEVMAGGTIAALVLTSLMSTLGSARVQRAIGKRLSVAQSLAVQGIETSNALDYSALTVTNLPVTEVVTPQQGAYTRTYTLTASTITVSGSALARMRVTCRVSFVVEGKTYTASMTTTRYRTAG